MKCKFYLITEGLHAHNVLPKNAPNTFGIIIVDNLTNKGEDMCHTRIMVKLSLQECRSLVMVLTPQECKVLLRVLILQE